MVSGMEGPTSEANLAAANIYPVPHQGGHTIEGQLSELHLIDPEPQQEQNSDDEVYEDVESEEDK